MNEQLRHYLNKLEYEMDAADLDTALENRADVIVIDA